MAHYRTGTIATTNGSAAITGTGTDFISGAAIGECIQAPDGKLYEIAAVVSATSLTLATPYLGSTASGQAYSIVPTQSYIRDLASQAAALVNGYQAVQDAAGAGKFTDGSLAVPGIRFTADDNTGLRRTGTDAVAVVTGGVDRLTVSAAGAVAIPGTLAVTGVITGPTAVAATNTTQLATTAHVFAERTNAATLTNKTLTAPIMTAPALGTPASGVLTNATGLPITTGVSGLGTGVATFLATPSSANLAAALTDESGTGALALTASPVFTGNPTAPTPALGDKDTSLATTEFVQREKEYLPVLSQSLHVGAIVKALVYDTSKDSDGGAWRQRCTDKSWYTETLGGSRWIGQEATIASAWTDAGAATGAVFQASATAGPLTIGKFYTATSATTATEVFRGITRDFPAVAGIVAETNRVVIYDLAAGAMWMVFVAESGSVMLSRAGANNHTSIAALNGRVCTATKVYGYAHVDFLSDSGMQYVNTGAGRLHNGPVSQRNNAVLGYKDTALRLVGDTANDVAITVLDNAPIDPATGLPTPTIAVATAGGVSVIKQDGTVVNSSITTNIKAAVLQGGYLYYGYQAGVAYGFYVVQISGLSAGFTGTFYTPTSVPALPSSMFPSAGGKYISYKAEIGNQAGLGLLKENPTTPAKGMVAYITNAYNSGWMPGDIRGAYLADTVAETVTQSGELVTNGTFATDTSGWTAGGGATLSFSSGKLGVTNTAGTSGFAQQAITTVVGKTYVASATFSGGGIYSLKFLVQTSPGTGVITSNQAVGDRTDVLTFVATTTTTYITAQVISGSAAAYFEVDNISVKLADPDRSVKNTGLVVNGTLTKTAVASGAGLVAYSGFSAANYLEQPYNSQLDFGTGDFSIMGWVTLSSTVAGQVLLCRGVFGSLTGFLQVSVGTGGTLSAYIGGTLCTFSRTVAAGLTYFICVQRVSGIAYLYLNAVQDSTTVAAASTGTNTSAVTRLGLNVYAIDQPASAASLALWRISATAPSADQIAHIYRTELPLFQAGAQCTIAGTSTAVTALAYDDATDLLHVGTSWGRTGFKDLLRVDSEATTTGALTSLSAQGGTVITGGTSAKLYVPAKYLRDELQRRDVARKALGSIPVSQDFTATSGQTAFIVTKGYDVRFVYVNGLLRRLTTDYTVADDGFQKTVTMTSGVPLSQPVTIMTTRS